MSDKGSVAPAAGSPRHTPGPWEVGEFAAHLDGVHIWAQPKRGRGRFASSRRIAQADNRGNQDEMHANARLIAAAPLLADVLHALYTDGMSFGSRLEQVVAALRAAGRLP